MNMRFEDHLGPMITGLAVGGLAKLAFAQWPGIVVPATATYPNMCAVLAGVVALAAHFGAEYELRESIVGAPGISTQERFGYAAQKAGLFRRRMSLLVVPAALALWALVLSRHICPYSSLSWARDWPVCVASSFGVLLVLPLVALLCLDVAAFVFYAAFAFPGIAAEEERNRTEHFARWGLWPGNLFLFQKDVGYRKVLSAPPWPFRTPDNCVLAPDSAHDARLRAAFAARRKRLLTLAASAFWLALPVVAGVYLWLNWHDLYGAFMRWPIVQDAMRFHEAVFTGQYRSREVQGLHNAIFSHGGIFGPEVFALSFGALAVLSVFALSFTKGAQAVPAALQALAVELLYVAGFQFLEHPRVCDPKFVKPRGWTRRDAKESGKVVRIPGAPAKRGPFSAPSSSPAPLE